MMTVIEKQTMDAIIAINRKTKDANQIDWEQRRYEIAKIYSLVVFQVKTAT